MATANAEGTVTTLTREDEIAAVRTALVNVLGEAVGDLDATAEAIVNEMDRIATEAYEASPFSGGAIIGVGAMAISQFLREKRP